MYVQVHGSEFCTFAFETHYTIRTPKFVKLTEKCLIHEIMGQGRLCADKMHMLV